MGNVGSCENPGRSIIKVINMEEATLCFIINSGKILLIKRKKGIGKGFWNGPGGRLEKGETPLDCVVREVAEEIGIKPLRPERIGFVEFYLEQENKPDYSVYVFRAEEFSGNLKETAEAKPKWFPIEKIPYNRMFAEDKQYWVPLVIEKMAFKGKFYFTNNWNRLLKKEVVLL